MVKSKSTYVEQVTPAMKRGGQGSVQQLHRIDRLYIEIGHKQSALENAGHDHRPLPPGRAVTAICFEDTSACTTCNEQLRLLAQRAELRKIQQAVLVEVARSAIRSHAGLPKAWIAKSDKAKAARNQKIPSDRYTSASNKARSQSELASLLKISPPTLRKFQLENGLAPIPRWSKKKRQSTREL